MSTIKNLRSKKDFVDIDKVDALLYNPHIRRDPYGTWNGKFNKEAMTRSTQLAQGSAKSLLLQRLRRTLCQLCDHVIASLLNFPFHVPYGSRLI